MLGAASIEDDGENRRERMNYLKDFPSEEVQMTDSKDSETGFVTGFILGTLVGIAIGFLYAPRIGIETREWLREKTEKMREKVLETAENAG